MAKVRTSAAEDQLSVVAQLLIDTQKNIVILHDSMTKLQLDKEAYKRYFLSASQSAVEEIKSVTGEEIATMERISKEVVSRQEESIKSIQQALTNALSKIEQATVKKVTTAKQVYWLAGIIGISVISLEVNRGFDRKLIQESLEKTKEAEFMRMELIQWMNENPKDAKKFKEWYSKEFYLKKN